MNRSVSLRLLVVILTGCFISTVAIADPNLAPEQLVLLMKASRERYSTFDVKKTVTNYQKADNDSKITLTLDITARWTRNKRYSRIIRTSYEHLDEIPHEGYTPTTINTYLIAPESSKRLEEAPDNRRPHGVIAPGIFSESSLELDQGFESAYGTMWSLFGFPWEKMNIKEATCSFDNDSNCYILKVPMGDYEKAPIFILHVDPSKDYIPAKKEYVKYTGTTIFTTQCSDFRRTAEGLWVPYVYTYSDRDFTVVSVVEQMKANEPISDNLFDFAFPDGTVVYDERYNIKYVVGESRQVQQPPVDPCSLASNSLAVSPVKDEELLTAASKAKKLLQAQADVAAAPPTIEVSPPIVFVTADKDEYTLSAARPDGKKPRLLAQTFESDTLEFISLKDLLQDKSQLIVTIKRLQSCATFASGTLLLEFEGENAPVTVTFVSPPLSNTP
ncbi:MAG: hypothetical protein JXN61_11930 [Sedimentisphaerales bacterium]|nr:hypothetical protein [Sedimentisphaerales bacterium]